MSGVFHLRQVISDLTYDRIYVVKYVGIVGVNKSFPIKSIYSSISLYYDVYSCLG